MAHRRFPDVFCRRDGGHDIDSMAGDSRRGQAEEGDGMENFESAVTGRRADTVCGHVYDSTLFIFVPALGARKKVCVKQVADLTVPTNRHISTTTTTASPLLGDWTAHGSCVPSAGWS